MVRTTGDETTFVLPEHWAGVIEPRRGGHSAPPANLAPDDDAYLLTRINDLGPRIDTVLTNDGTSADLAREARAYLDGTFTPLGAAAVVAMLCREENADDREAWYSRWRYAGGLLRRHGIEFAATAMAELGGRVQVTWDHTFRGDSPHLLVAGAGSWLPPVTWMRRILAGTDQSSYDAVVDALGALRERVPETKLAVSYLVPTRVDWVDELFVDVFPTMPDNTRSMLLYSVNTPAQFDQLVSRKRLYYHLRDALYTVVDALGPDALPGLAKMLDNTALADARTPILKVIAALPTDEAFQVLVDRLGEKMVRPVLMDAIDRYPVRAARLLAGHPLLGTPSPPEATNLPPQLVRPVWLGKRVKRPVVTGPRRPVSQAMAWEPGERGAWAVVPSHVDSSAAWYLEATEAEIRPLLSGLRPEVRGAVEWAKVLVSRYELDAFRLVWHVVVGDPVGNGSLAMPYADTGFADLMARYLVREPAAREVAEAWLTRHAAFAATALVPAALAKPHPGRTEAEAALRFLSSHTDVLVAAKVYGVSDEIAAVLAIGPWEDLPARIPVPGEWADPAQLPRIRLRDAETVLPLDVVGHVLTMLAMSTLRDTYVGVRVVKDLCDPESLAEFGWVLFERWREVDEPAKDSWALTAQGLIGSDRTADRLVPVVNRWPGYGKHARAVEGLDVLVAINPGRARDQLSDIAANTEFKGCASRRGNVFWRSESGRPTHDDHPDQGTHPRGGHRER
ncbi:hypothetical protein GCM10029964_069790 [Kibdelosporangium lantanae]